MNTLLSFKQRLRLALLLLSGSAAGIQAQASWTLDSCMQYAIEKNLQLKNSRLDTRIARENVTAAIGNFLPRVSASGALGKRLGRSIDPESNLYTSSSFMENEFGLNLSVPIFEGFTRINKAQFTRLNQRISRLTEKTDENCVAFDVMNAFYLLSFDTRMYELAVEQRKLSERYHEQMLAFVDLGLRSPSELQEVKARLQSDIYQETVKANGCRLSLLALKELLQMHDSDSLAINDTRSENNELLPLPGFSAAEVYAQSESLLPEFRMMYLREQASRKSLAMATGAFSPAIRAEFTLLSGYYGTIRNEQGQVVSFGDQMKNNVKKYIGVSISFPLFDGFSRITQVRKERFRLRRIQNENDQQRLTLYKEIEEACLTLQAAAQEHRQAQLQVQSAATTLKESEEKWEEGMISVFELMEKRNMYISARAELSRTRLQYEMKERTVRFYQTGSFQY